MQTEEQGAGVAPRPETITTSCLLCSKELVWHCDARHVDKTAHDYCSTWCMQGHTLLKNLHAELCRGRRRIEEATDIAARQCAMDAGEGVEPEPYAEENAQEAQIAANIKDLVLLTYDGIRRLDNLKFYSWGQSDGPD